MKTKIYIKCVLVISILVTYGCGSQGSKNDLSTNKKNVVFIIADDLNKTLGTYGHPIVKTPNIDKLASLGIQFENAHCNYAVCNPSRTSFLTGIRPENLGILDNRTALQSVLGDRQTLPMLFKNNGYHTVNIGKIFHSRKESFNDMKAWDELHQFKSTAIGEQGEGRNITDGALKWCNWKATEGGDEDQKDGQNAAKAVEFIKSAHDEPFFLAVGFHKPHDPFHAPKKYFDLYPMEDCNPPEMPIDWQPAYNHSLPTQYPVFAKFTDQDKREFLRSYYACVSFMDAQVGKVITALEETKQLDNTLIVFISDHGYHLGEHNWWNKVTLYENGTSAPFIVMDPSIKQKGYKTGAMIEFIDIYPTLASLCDLKGIPNYLEGESFEKVLVNPELPMRSEVRSVIRRGKMLGKSVKNEKWRYISWGEGKQGHELYHQVSDRAEYNNLAEDPRYADEVKVMQGLLAN
ncbi:MAG: sulfatase [Reichenbachiella sp.]